jgi:hypothetical protein
LGVVILLFTLGFQRGVTDIFRVLRRPSHEAPSAKETS